LIAVAPNELPAATSSPLDRALAALRANSGTPDHAARTAHLLALEALLQDNRAAFEDAIAADFGHRSRHETRLLELFPSLAALRHARSNLRKWMKPQRAWASFWFLPARTEIRPQPLGVAGIIVPWNYPLFLAVSPLAGALAAGNRAMIKMSEASPATGALLERLVAASTLADRVTVVNGNVDVARAFAALPFDHLLFTGSTAVGRDVMRAAAANLVPVTLELGGKSPAILGADFPVAEAARRILFGKCLNAGQTCVAPDYVLVPRALEHEFIAAAQAVVARFYPALKDNPDYTSIVDARHRARLAAYLDDARLHGARVLDLAPPGAVPGAGQVAPQIVSGVTDAMRVMQEEIFGPLLPVIPYDGLDAAIEFVNRRPRPLALYYFGYNERDTARILDETVAGGVTVNDTIMHISQEDLPFGGVGPSGMGAYHGRYGFDLFSLRKPVFRQSRFNALGMLQPPFGKRIDALLRILLR